MRAMISMWVVLWAAPSGALAAPPLHPASPAAQITAPAGPGACKGRRKKARKKRGAQTPKAAQPAPAAAAPGAAPTPRADGAPGTLRRSNRMEFDARVVKGERATGAVYLFQRVPRRLPPLVTLAPDPLDRIVRPVLHRGVAPASAAPAQDPAR